MQALRTRSEIGGSPLLQVNPQQQDAPVRKGWRPQGRRCLMELEICRVDSFSVPERMPDACGGSETSRQGSELLQRGSYSRPWNPETANNCFGWALMDPIITGYRSMKLMMRMVPEFRKETEIWRPNSWLGLSGWKSPLTAAHVSLQRSIPCTR